VARTITARIRLTNRDDLLRLGLFGVARVATAEESKKAGALVVPRSAITEIAQKPVVFVRQLDGDFDLHEVVLGSSGLGKVEVVSGLREGEQVVKSGVFTLKSAVLKSTFGEDDE
jgi:membrane fusion protein, heavy metal efflux system